MREKKQATIGYALLSLTVEENKKPDIHWKQWVSGFKFKLRKCTMLLVFCSFNNFFHFF